MKILSGLQTEGSHLRRAGAVAGAFEGIAIARYEVLGRPLSPRSCALAIGIVLLAVAMQWLFWAVVEFLSRKRSRRSAFRIGLAIWLAVVLVGRLLLGDRLDPAMPWLVGIALLLGFVVPDLSWWSLPRPLSRAIEVASLLLVTAASLLGRVPDQTWASWEQASFLVTSALVGGVLVLAAVRLPWVLAAAGLLLLAGSGLATAPAQNDRPNVLWILVDTLRRDHVEPFGDLSQTPDVRKLASEGVLFEDAVTVVPKTPASVASFMTGLYPVHHGVRTLYSPMAEGLPTVADRFAEAGYDTAAFINNAWLTAGRGFAQGFERFDGYYEVNRPYGSLGYLGWVLLVDQVTLGRIPAFSSQTDPVELTDRVVAFLESERERPFFAYVHYFHPHWPYLPPPAAASRYVPSGATTVVNHPEAIGMSRGTMIFQNFLPAAENETAKGLYRGEVDHTMEQVGRLLDRLRERDLDERTLVVFTADHGHSLGEQDYFFHHGEFLYDSTVRIPLILRWSGVLPAGVTVRAQVRSIDVAPTVLELTGLAPLARVDGESLVPTWTGRSVLPRPALLESDVKMFPENLRRELGGIPGKLRGVRDGRFKLVIAPTHRGPRYELYDLRDDPGELHNLATDPEHAEVLARLSTFVLARIPDSERRLLAGLAMPHEGGPATGPSEAEQEHLRSLGYLD